MTGSLRKSVGLLATLVIGLAHAQSQPAPSRTESAEINLRKSIVVREYQGRQVSGEEHQIGRGDSLWRILVEEKGVGDRRFHSYLVVIRGLNPQIKNLDVLRAGDKIFIPLKLGDIEEAPARAGAGAGEALRSNAGRTITYQVKSGEYLYRILRERYKDADDRKIAQYVALVKDLNPERQNWESLHGGEIIRLPALDSDLATAKFDGRTPIAASTASAGSPRAPAPIIEAPAVSPGASTASSRRLEVEEAMRAPARDNMQLLLKVMEATGHEVQSRGEESVTLPDGTVHFDKNSYPVIYNGTLRQRAVIDPDGKIPASLKTKLNDPTIGIPVVPMGNSLPIADAVRQLLASIGYQPLPADRPVVVQESGITFEAKGDWMALAPAVSNKPQEVMILNLTHRSGEVPAYLSAELAKLGVHFRDVVMPAATPAILPISAQRPPRNGGPARELPKDRRELVDALLSSFQVPFMVAENLSVDLRDGVRLEIRVDRLFEIEGKRTAIFFRRVDPLVRESLQEKHNTSTLELEVDSLSSRAIINRVLAALGDQASYGEHRFSAVEGAARDRLTLKAWGFNVRTKPMFVTDRQIAPALQRFFFEKGLEIVYFQ
jgi:hypothetical protein